MNFTVLSAQTARLDGNIYGGWEGSDYSSGALGRFLNANQGKDVTLYVTSNGGDVMAGLGLGALIAAHGRVTVCVAGLVASAGTFIAANAKTTQIMENSLLLVHNTKGGTYGGAQDVQKQADLMKKMDNEILPNMYVGTILRNKKGVKKTTAEIKPMIIEVMSKDLPLTAQECIEYGFASKIITIEEGAAATANPLFTNASIITQMPQESYDEYLYNLQALMPEESEQKTTLTNFFQPMQAETKKALKNLQPEDPQKTVLSQIKTFLTNLVGLESSSNPASIDFDAYVKGLQDTADSAQVLEDTTNSNPIHNNQNNDTDMALSAEEVKKMVDATVEPLTAKLNTLTNSLTSTQSQLEAEAKARKELETQNKDLQAKLEAAEVEKLKLQTEKAEVENKQEKQTTIVAGADSKKDIDTRTLAQKGRDALKPQMLATLENAVKNIGK